MAAADASSVIVPNPCYKFIAQSFLSLPARQYRAAEIRQQVKILFYAAGMKKGGL